MQLLRTFIRSIISEAAKDVSSAASSGLALYTYHNDKSFVLYDPDKMYELLTAEVQRVIKSDDKYDGVEESALKWAVYGTINISIPYWGRCNNAAMIRQSAARTGWGPLMYDIAMSAAPNGLAADRGSVSDSAKKVWDYYDSGRMDVEATPFDDVKFKRTPPESDDCAVHSTDTEDSSIDKSYVLDAPIDVSSLKRNHDAFVSYMLGWTSKHAKKIDISAVKLESYIHVAAVHFFEEMYM